MASAGRADDARQLKFQEVSDGLRRGILAGTWAAGDRLPSEQQLVASTGYSLNTIRRAFDELELNELVERRQGAGTFVTMRAQLGAKRRRTVGIMVPHLTEYFPRVLQGVEAALAHAGVGLQITNYDYDVGRENECIRRLLDGGADGLLLVPTLLGLRDPLAKIRRLTTLPVPTVLLERHLSSLGPADASEYVCSDHEGGAYDAVSHLVRLGHRRIALLVRSGSATAAGTQAGYRAAVNDFSLGRGLVRTASREKWERTRADGMLDAVRQGGVTAALVFGDREAMLLAGAASRQGLSVPGDLALVSYDDEAADRADVPMTAISPPKHRIGRLAAQILLQRIQEGDESPLHQIRVRPHLVIRESCGAVLPTRT